ncbi:hypothetical protein HPB47_001991 [Ixodes persulcatus]|uniref:Uncharacterized protein n=1 Tax=Ixodes persulcatus TaxID=34615 RepID=A0AC60PMJ2_IXOPE|nr:hypothetical protein HPB47_001991 [Ixodes persulcatus]
MMNEEEAERATAPVKTQAEQVKSDDASGTSPEVSSPVLPDKPSVDCGSCRSTCSRALDGTSNRERRRRSWCFAIVRRGLHHTRDGRRAGLCEA